MLIRRLLGARTRFVCSCAGTKADRSAYCNAFRSILIEQSAAEVPM